MCSASDDSTARVWDFNEGILLRNLEDRTMTKAVLSAQFLGTQGWHVFCVATCGVDLTTRIFDMRDKEVVYKLEGHTSETVGKDFCELKGLPATGSDDGTILIWDRRNFGRRMQTLDTQPHLGNNSQVKRVKFSPCGDYLAAATEPNTVLVYKVQQPRKP